MKKHQQSLARLRVAVGLLLSVFIFVASAFASYADDAPTRRRKIATNEGATRVTHALPFVNANGYATRLVTINTTNEPVDVVIEDRVYPPLVETYEPHTVYSEKGWPRPGAGIEEVELDARLTTYVVFTSPRGSMEAQAPLVPIAGDVAEFYDLPLFGEFEASVLIAVQAGDGGYFSIESGGETINGTIGTARHDGVSLQVIPVRGDHATLRLGDRRNYPELPAPTKVYAFGIIEHNATGAFDIVPAYVSGGGGE